MPENNRNLLPYQHLVWSTKKLLGKFTWCFLWWSNCKFKNYSAWDVVQFSAKITMWLTIQTSSKLDFFKWMLCRSFGAGNGRILPSRPRDYLKNEGNRVFEQMETEQKTIKLERTVLLGTLYSRSSIISCKLFRRSTRQMGFV